MRRRPTPLVSLLLTLSLGCAAGAAAAQPAGQPGGPPRARGAAAPPPAPGRARVSPPADMRPAKPAVPAADDFRGAWISDLDPAHAVTITGTTSDEIRVLAPARFLATGFVEGPGAVALAHTLAPADPAASGARFGVLQIDREDPTTLHVEFSDLRGTVVSQETWTKQGAPVRPKAPPVAAAPPSDGLPKFGDYVYVEELPEAITKVQPVYPDAAREKGIDGQVLVQALVGKDGRVQDTRVVKSIPALDGAAVACVKQWVFKPALSKGAPVAVWVAVPVKFSLH